MENNLHCHFVCNGTINLQTKRLCLASEEASFSENTALWKKIKGDFVPMHSGNSVGIHLVSKHLLQPNRTDAILQHVAGSAYTIVG